MPAATLLLGTGHAWAASGSDRLDIDHPQVASGCGGEDHSAGESALAQDLAWHRPGGSAHERLALRADLRFEHDGLESQVPFGQAQAVDGKLLGRAHAEPANHDHFVLRQREAERHVSAIYRHVRDDPTADRERPHIELTDTSGEPLALSSSRGCYSY